MPLDTSVLNRHALTAEATGLLLTGRKIAVRPYHPPPRQSVGRGENIANRTCRARVTGSLGDLAVAGHLSPIQVPHNLLDCLDERQSRLHRH